DAGQLPDHREPAEVSLLLRRRLQGGVPDRLREVPYTARNRRRALAAPVPPFPARQLRSPPRPWRQRAPTKRPPFPRLRAVLRILPRRQRPRRRRLAPNRLDRPRRQAAATPSLASSARSPWRERVSQE